MHISLYRNLSTIHIIIFSSMSRTLSLRHQFSFLEFSCSQCLWVNSEFGLMTNMGHIPITFSECSTSTLGLRGQNPIIGYCPCCMDCSWNNVDCRCTNCYLCPGGLSPLSPQLNSQGHTGCSIER